jgi:Effector Associated Constant Component 1
VAEERGPVRLILLAPASRGGEPSLLAWIRRSAEYNGRVQVSGGSSGGAGIDGSTMLSAILSPVALLGLFRLIRAWIDAQRSNVTVRIRVPGSNVEIRVTGRSEPARLVSEVMQATGRIAATPPIDATAPPPGSSRLD